MPTTCRAAGAALTVAAALALLATPGCDPGGEDDARHLEVILREWSIAMPEEAPAGPLTLEVFNAGSRAHDFEIDGQGVHEGLPGSLDRGERRAMQIDLRPGTYRVWCPMDEHAGLGMVTTLTVTSGPAAGAPGDRP